MVLTGEKVATSSLLDYYLEGLKKKSSVGDCLAVLDSCDNQIAIIKIVKTEIRRFGDITESFAIQEGDGSLTNWKAIHRPYYSKLLSSIGKQLTDNTELVCEWFQVIEE